MFHIYIHKYSHEWILQIKKKKKIATILLGVFWMHLYSNILNCYHKYWKIYKRGSYSWKYYFHLNRCIISTNKHAILHQHQKMHTFSVTHSVVVGPVPTIKSSIQVNMTKYIFNGSHMLHKVQEKFKNAYNDNIQCAKCLQ